MKYNSFATRMFIMNALVETPSASGTPDMEAAVAPARKSKAINITVSETAKKFLEDFKSEFSGPSISDPEKPKFLTSEEAIDALIEAVTDRRISYVQSTDENGNPVFDGDKQPVMEAVDHLAVSAQKQIDSREGTFRAGSAKDKLAKAEAELANTRALLASLGFKDGHLPTPEELAKAARKRHTTAGK